MILVFNLDNTSLPKWVNWIAQDADGAWWAYEVEPLQFHKGWYENEVGKYQRLEYENEAKSWKESLLRVDNDNK